MNNRPNPTRRRICRPHNGAFRHFLEQTLGCGVRVMCADETFVKLRGEKVVVGFVADAASSQLLGMDFLARQDAASFLEWLEGYAREFGVQTLVTDDLATYKPVVEELGLGHLRIRPFSIIVHKVGTREEASRIDKTPCGHENPHQVARSWGSRWIYKERTGT